MATAWELLQEGSTLDDGTAWEHINNLGGGPGGPGEDRYVLTDLRVDADIAVESVLDLQPAMISGTVDAGGELLVEVQVGDVSLEVLVEAEDVTIDNPDEIEV